MELYKSHCHKVKVLHKGGALIEGVNGLKASETPSVFYRLPASGAFSRKSRNGLTAWANQAKPSFKGRCRKPMKAQLVFEFMVAVVIFFGIIFYIINYLNTTVSGYSGDFYSENMESKASQIGELLVLNRGKWSGQTPDVVGLAEDWPVLNSTKIAWLDGYCNNNYPGLADKLGISYKNKLKIIINETESDGTVSNLVDCPYGKKVPGVARAEAKRYAVLNNGDIVTVYVYIW